MFDHRIFFSVNQELQGLVARNVRLFAFIDQNVEAVIVTKLETEAFHAEEFFCKSLLFLVEEHGSTEILEADSIV